MTDDPITGDLNPEQHRAVTHGSGVIVVLAGPGSGKTRVITRRIALLAGRREVPANSILAVTFTNKAAQEMRNRVIHTLGEEQGSLPTISTFHSACVRILRKHGQTVGIPRAFSILDTNDSKKMIRGLLAEHQMPAEPAQVKETQSAISSYKNGVGDGADVGPVLQSYMERCRLMGAVDFDDLLLLARRALEEHEEVREACRRRWTHLLVDEYQDTNPTQARLVQLLASPHNPEICVVGDADQSIYGFRNASPRAFEDLLATWPDATVVRLDRNYRSVPQIVDLCRTLIADQQDDERLQMQMRSQREEGQKPQLVYVEDDRAEAKHVVGSIRRGRRRSAILTRTNAQTRVIEEELARHRVPYQTVGTLRYYDRAEVKDALSWMRAAINRNDRISLERAASSVPQGIGQRTIDLLTAGVADGLTLPQIADNLPSARSEAVLRFDSLLNSIAQAAESGARAAVREVLYTTGLIEHHSKGDGGTDRRENLEELLSAAADSEGTLEGAETFLQDILLASEDGEEGENEVLLMTAHAAKGREFPDVYVCGVEDGLFPHTNSRKDHESKKEELRLLYVACSRAEEMLMLSVAGRRFIHGEIRNQEPSPFLESIEHLTEVTDMRRTREAFPVSRPRTSSWASSPTRTRSVLASGPREPRPSPPSGPRLRPEDIPAGTQVRHAKFGAGTVLSVHGGNPADATVLFEDGKERRLRLDLAPLTLE